MLLSSTSLYAQLQGKVNYEHLGISFTIPAGWQGQEFEDGILLGSNSMAGIVLITTHQYTSIDQLRQEAAAGISEAGGTRLSMQGDFESLGQLALGARFEGTFEYEQARAYIAGIVNPKGMGLSFAAITTASAYQEAHEQLIRKLVGSVSFTAAQESSEVAEWRQYLQNVRLTYMDSYYSSGYGSGGVGGGYSTEIKIDLCKRGFFNYHSDSDMTISGDGISGYSDGGNQGQGSWQIVNNAQGAAILQLHFYNGEVYEYTLTYQDQKVHLNGNRYFVTSEGEYAPNCN